LKGKSGANGGLACGHRWVTAQGPYDGDTATLTGYLTESEVFDTADSPAVSDEIPPPRIVADNEALCEALMEQ